MSHRPFVWFHAAKLDIKSVSQPTNSSTYILVFNVRIRFCTFVVRKIKYQFQIGAFDLMFYWRFEYQWTIKFIWIQVICATRRDEMKRKIKSIFAHVCIWLISLNNNTFRLFCMHKLQLTYRKWCVQCDMTQSHIYTLCVD